MVRVPASNGILLSKVVIMSWYNQIVIAKEMQRKKQVVCSPLTSQLTLQAQRSNRRHLANHIFSLLLILIGVNFRGHQEIQCD